MPSTKAPLPSDRLHASPRRTRVRGLPGPACLALALSVAASACAEEPGPGAVVIPVELGNQKTCGDVEVVTLTAQLGPHGEETPCGDEAREIRFDGIDEGMYDLSVTGKIAEGIATMDSGGGPKLVVEVIGDGATVRANKVRLTDSPAHLLIRWDFDFQNCQGANIHTFMVEAFQAGGTKLVLQGVVDCATSDIDESGYFHVPDEQRAVDGNLLGEVAIQPQDQAGVPVGSPLTYMFDPPGPGRNVRFTLSGCSEAGCTGSGLPDDP